MSTTTTIDLTRNPDITRAAGAREWFDMHREITALVSHIHHGNSNQVTPTAVHINVVGDPQVQARLRHVPFGIYDPQKQFKNEYRRRLKAALIREGFGDFPIFPRRTHLCVTVTFNVVRMTKDIDNLLKLILDVLNGPVYANDADVTMVVAKKTHARNGDDGPYTSLTVETV